MARRASRFFSGISKIWMAEKGIKFDSGDIDVEIDGEKVKMTTRKDDFGTMLLPEDYEIIRSGVEKTN